MEFTSWGRMQTNRGNYNRVSQCYDSGSTRCDGNRKQGHLTQTRLFKGGDMKDEEEVSYLRTGYGVCKCFRKSKQHLHMRTMKGELQEEGGETNLEREGPNQIIQVLESKGFPILSVRITWGTLKQTNKTQMSALHLRPIKLESLGMRPCHCYF